MTALRSIQPVLDSEAVESVEIAEGRFGEVVRVKDHEHALVARAFTFAPLLAEAGGLA